MSTKLRLARLAAWAERWMDALRRAPEGVPEIVPYIGYATPASLVIRGRVLIPRAARLARPDQSRFANFRAMVSLFRTDEVAGVKVDVDGKTVVSDEEGYITAEIPLGTEAGWTEVLAKVNGKVSACPVIVPDPQATFGVISDVDDTMIRTGAYSLWRNVWTSMTGNSATREVFSDAVRLMDKLKQPGNPVFYVSSSPWNFYPFLRDVMGRASLPDGPMFLRDYGISRTKLITGTHGDHKGQSIDTILAANSDLGFVLVGDTGQHDAQVYLDAAERHPGRIIRVILRHAGRAADSDAVHALRALDIPVHVGPNYDDMDI